ncbi:DUF1580 domain-containing protein [Stieleria varia]|uniref:DUF1580 domain-containing protein n=1 Tax=Stieleria varia TaxID=2528005 RepID=A0A5C6BAU9_9BACT|nr:DUF1580 domain-containing protein [Stieleria varia]TWU08386.1 hypothetical protein Pla52n_09680 [Stieleria varia]
MSNTNLLRILSEDAIPLSDVPSMIPGRRPHVSTIWRWHRNGVRGVRLEAVRVGRSVITSKQAVTRFLIHLNPPSKEGGKR